MPFGNYHLIQPAHVELFLDLFRALMTGNNIRFANNANHHLEMHDITERMTRNNIMYDERSERPLRYDERSERPLRYDERSERPLRQDITETIRSIQNVPGSPIHAAKKRSPSTHNFHSSACNCRTFIKMLKLTIGEVFPDSDIPPEKLGWDLYTIARVKKADRAIEILHNRMVEFGVAVLEVDSDDDVPEGLV